MFRRMEDRIRKLSQDLVQEKDEARSLELARQLRAALHEHSARLRSRVMEYPVGKLERRARKKLAPSR